MPSEVCTHPWRHAAEPFRIAGNLYYVGNADVSSHLIDTAEGLILLDTAFPQTVYLLLESIRRLGFDPHDIAYILHCHAHYDHMGGTKALAELTGARTVMGRADAEMMHNHPELTWAPEYGVEFHELFDADVPLVGGEAISLGGTEITCVHTPGHTPGCISYFFDVVEGGETYRAGIHGGPGTNTLTDEYTAKYALPQSRRADYLASLERLRQETVDIFIGAHPGQNRTFEKQAAMTPESNPFIDRDDWQAFLADLERAARRQFGME